ncbi:unnamed protein product [Meloidogyne enterolobii]|uniref:Uncharacterized protein n=1 Tax=Meloidogyne enterolobii TaxID=390850 RepID=A0ACB0XYS2_MELEN
MPSHKLMLFYFQPFSHFLFIISVGGVAICKKASYDFAPTRSHAYLGRTQKNIT